MIFLAEVDYAHTLRKTIIPIIVDVDFVPDGWLKELVDNVQSFDFSRRSMFAGSLDALLEHVKTVCSPDLSNGEVTLNIEGNLTLKEDNNYFVLKFCILSLLWKQFIK